MHFYPAIDIKNGKCIRLKKGSLNEITEYQTDPLSQAKDFYSMGTSWIHIVDIDGAFDGKNINHETILKIKKEINCNIQVGGGIRDYKSVELFLNNNIDRIVLGTVALKKPTFVKEICKSFPGKIAVGLDTKKGLIAIEGWSKTSNVTFYDLAKKYEDAGVSALILTDIDKDGLMKGVNQQQLESLLASTSLNVIASGGVSKLHDLRKLKKIKSKNLIGVISGRAIYEKKFTVKQALKILEDI